MPKEDSEEKILKDWNALGLEQDIPYRSLVFTHINGLYRYLDGQAKQRGAQSRKERLDRLKGVNIASPKESSVWDKVVKRNKNSEEKLTTYALIFLERIRVVRKGKRLD